MIPFVDLKAQYQGIKEEVNTAIQRVLDSCDFVLGKEVEGFEKEFAGYCQRQYGVALNSGTAALHLALLSVGIGAGDGSGGPGWQGGQGGGASVSMAIKNFLTGKNQEMGGGAQGVFELMDRDVSGVAEAIIESAKESGDFEAVIKKFVGWLSKNVTPILVEKKKDPAKFIQKLFDSFKKQREGAALFPSSDAVIEECSNEIKTAMVQDAFSLYKASPKKAVNAAVKILGDEDDQNKILPKLKERFTAAGANSDEADSFIQKTKTELAKDEEVPISKKKLAKLMRLSERFDEEVGQKVQIATEELRRHNKRLFPVFEIHKITHDNFRHGTGIARINLRGGYSVQPSVDIDFNQSIFNVYRQV